MHRSLERHQIEKIYSLMDSSRAAGDFNYEGKARLVFRELAVFAYETKARTTLSFLWGRSICIARAFSRLEFYRPESDYPRLLHSLEKLSFRMLARQGSRLPNRMPTGQLLRLSVPHSFQEKFPSAYVKAAPLSPRQEVQRLEGLTGRRLARWPSMTTVQELDEFVVRMRIPLSDYSCSILCSFFGDHDLLTPKYIGPDGYTFEDLERINFAAAVALSECRWLKGRPPAFHLDGVVGCIQRVAGDVAGTRMAGATVKKIANSRPGGEECIRSGPVFELVRRLGNAFGLKLLGASDDRMRKNAKKYNAAMR